MQVNCTLLILINLCQNVFLRKCFESHKGSLRSIAHRAESVSTQHKVFIHVLLLTEQFSLYTGIHGKESLPLDNRAERCTVAHSIIGCSDFNNVIKLVFG
jgi:hypothetical protein